MEFDESKLRGKLDSLEQKLEEILNQQKQIETKFQINSLGGSAEVGSNAFLKNEKIFGKAENLTEERKKRLSNLGKSDKLDPNSTFERYEEDQEGDLDEGQRRSRPEDEQDEDSFTVDDQVPDFENISLN